MSMGVSSQQQEGNRRPVTECWLQELDVGISKRLMCPTRALPCEKSFTTMHRAWKVVSRTKWARMVTQQHAHLC